MTSSYLFVEIFTSNHAKPIIGKVRTLTFHEFLEDSTKDWLVIRNNGTLNTVFRDNIERIVAYEKRKIIRLGLKSNTQIHKNNTSIQVSE